LLGFTAITVATNPLFPKAMQAKKLDALNVIT
ncbi:unnamed protein product, partial [marine sediment metagenome]